MPNFRNFFSSLIIALVPLVVASFFFFQILTKDKSMQNNIKNVLGASVSEYTSSFSTPDEKTNFLSNILDSILKINEPGTTGFFNKIKLSGRVDAPVLFDLEDDQAYLWLSQGKTKLYLSAFGEDKVEILTDKFFNRDLNFKKDINITRNLNVFGDTYFWGGMELTGNFNGSTATLSNAYISEDLLIDGNLYGNTATLSYAYISEDLLIGKNLATDTATISTAYISGDLSIDGNITGTTATLSAAYISEDLWVDQNLTAETATIANAYISGTLTSINGRFTDLNTNRFSATSGYVTNFGVTNNFSAAMASFNEMGVYGAFSAAQGLFTTRLDVALFSAGNSTLANTRIVGNLDITGVLAASFSTLADTTINGNLSVLGGNSLFITGNAWIGGNFSASSARLTGNLSAGTAYINGYFSAGNSSLSTATINGDFTVTGNAFLATTSTFAARFFSSPNSDKTIYFSNQTISTRDLLVTRIGSSSDRVNQGYFTYLEPQTLSVSGIANFFDTVSAINLNLTGTLSGAGASLSSAYISGNLTAVAGIITDLYSDRFSGANGNFTDLYATRFSAANGNLTDLFATRFSASSGYLTNLGVTNNFSAANLGLTGTFSVPDGRFSNNLGVEANFSAANIGVTSAFSAATGVFSGNLSAGTAYVNGAFSAGNSSLGALYLNGSVTQVETSSMALGSRILIRGNRGDGYLQSLGFSSPVSAIYGAGILHNTNGDFIMNNYNPLGQFQYNMASGNFQIFASDTSFANPILVTNINRLTIAMSAPMVQIYTQTKPWVLVNNVNRNMATEATSDLRLKAGVETINDAVSRISQLRGVYYNWKVTPTSDATLPHREFGLIAQEVYSLYPELTDRTGDGYFTLDYSKLTALLIEGVKEQKLQIEGLSEAVGNLNITQMQSLYDNFNTALENLSMSSEDGKLIINSGLTVTGQALFNSANFTGDVKVGQVKVDSLENDISVDTASCVDMDGNPTSNCDTNKLNIMKNKSGNVEMFGGKVKFKPNGEVMGEKVQAKTFKNNSSTAPSGSDSCTTGEFKFAEESGQSYIFYCNSSSNWVRSQLSNY